VQKSLGNAFIFDEKRAIDDRNVLLQETLMYDGDVDN
jgi:hypothetical protein